MIEFVLDCSVAISWCLVDEDNDYANAVLDIMPNAEAFVPEIWSLEIVNTLLVAERRNRMTVEQTQASINWLQSLLITIDSLTSVQAFGRTLTLAREQKLASYDAAYLELALRLDLPLATNDKQLIDAALRCQVELLNPALN
ncbi:MAG: type II toxin-antitoxin system VapC family toxin [Microcystis aeruginosa K13-05]|uniref:type II toxin-antitoxin system VapC family toxin n=1 Tax=unclassified Microcystis TaxID=2643300 RepID=UPI0022C75540|nr:MULTISPECIES: type II toxin-antitoxin system VapC family toxin [unclassified Microcystis]MCZ8048299.1 type II toxin-antitoxin system VapC family toxin [Microcystis sp. LE19-41.2A]MCZ8287911.1 type II toxin-antitoxin system VapC family toxin [Microcystis sp. LE19-59.1C]NCR79510.1 type II toxin-antitoxin system VapC family toxin [Microcystis aeruginosa K13-10]NCR84184.1 type II toxin-antitoxin system VapC family toxin [Microcystis aeruginosa K13-05]